MFFYLFLFPPAGGGKICNTLGENTLQHFWGNWGTIKCNTLGGHKITRENKIRWPFPCIVVYVTDFNEPLKFCLFAKKMLCLACSGSILSLSCRSLLSLVSLSHLSFFSFLFLSLSFSLPRLHTHTW